MRVIDPLMKEHGLIQRMVSVVDRENERVKRSGRLKSGLIEELSDFFQTYANKTHHGKEEDILFKFLSQKPLAPEISQALQDLLAEHTVGRRLLGDMGAFKGRELSGDSGDSQSLNRLTSLLDSLAQFYPAHIFKEENRLFLPCLDYFTNDEQQSILRDYWEFDRQLIHIKYNGMVESLEKTQT